MPGILPFSNLIHRTFYSTTGETAANNFESTLDCWCSEPDLPSARQQDRLEARDRIAEAKKQHAKKLDLSGLDLGTLPDGLSKLKSLKELKLNGCNLTELPDSLSKLKNLKRLYINANQLSALPQTTATMDKLKVLSASGNHFAQWPEAINNLGKLKELDLSNNQLLEIPATVSGLRLEELNISDNQLTALPKEIFKRRMTFDEWSMGGMALIRILAANNQFETISDTGISPAVFGYCWYLDLSNNPIETISRREGRHYGINWDHTEPYYDGSEMYFRDTSYQDRCGPKFNLANTPALTQGLAQSIHDENKKHLNIVPSFFNATKQGTAYNQAFWQEMLDKPGAASFFRLLKRINVNFFNKGAFLLRRKPC